MPTVTKNLIIINVLVFFGTLVAQRYGIDLTNYRDCIFSSPVTSIRHSLSLICSCMADSATFFSICLLFSCSELFLNGPGDRNVSFFIISSVVSAQDLSRKECNTSIYSRLQPLFTSGYRTGIIPMGEFLNMLTTVGASGAVYAILLAFGMLFPNNQLFIFRCPSLSKLNSLLSVML